jgi:hypothetical protein
MGKGLANAGELEVVPIASTNGWAMVARLINAVILWLTTFYVLHAARQSMQDAGYFS